MGDAIKLDCDGSSTRQKEYRENRWGRGSTPGAAIDNAHDKDHERKVFGEPYGPHYLPDWW
jgi:hypothetical protein